MSDTPRTDDAEYLSTDEPPEPLGMVDTDFARELERELNAANARIKRLEEAGDGLREAANLADDDIREHLQVANYNLHGLLNTGERVEPPNPPQIVHQDGIYASVACRNIIQHASRVWDEAKENKP